MKREIAHHKELKIRAPAAPKAQARALAEFLTFMIEAISTKFRNQVLDGMHPETVEKFADSEPFGANFRNFGAPLASEPFASLAKTYFADRKRKKPQVGNYANVYLELAARIRRKLVKQFDDDRIDRMVAEVIDKANTHNRAALYQAIERRMGIDSATLASDEGLSFTINALEAETAQWAKKLRDDTLEHYTANTLRDMTLGRSLEDLMSAFDGMVETRKGQAKYIARTQINNFNSITTKIRAQNLGLEEGEWITARDGINPKTGKPRVRPSHRDRDGKRFDLAKGLYSAVDGKYLLPGCDHNCRCTMLLVVPEE